MEVIVCYSPGGAEQISEYVKLNFRKKKFLFFLGGPAIKIFKNKIGQINNDNIKKFNTFKFDKIFKYCLLGSGTASRFELNHLKFFKQKKLKTIVFLDHWSQYKQRFNYNKNYIYPDQIWVSDQHAYNKAKKIFKVPIKRKKNFLLAVINKKYKSFKKEKKYNLFISQPLKEDSKTFNPKLNYDQFKAFKYLYQKKKKLLEKVELKIKLHPSEKKYYWEKFIKKNFKDARINLIKRGTLEKIFAKTISVFGCASMAMYISSELGIKTFCCIPPGGKKSSLPSKKIKNI